MDASTDSKKKHRNMKVLMVNRAMPCHIAGGLERHVEDLILGLASRDSLEIHLLSAELDASDQARYADAGIKVHATPPMPVARYSLKYLRSIGTCIDQLHAEHQFDIIHGQEFSLGFWKPQTIDAPKIVLTVHGTITSETPLHPDVYATLPNKMKLAVWKRYGRRLLFAPVWKRALKQSDRIMVDSAFTWRELEKLKPVDMDKVSIVPLAVHESVPEPPDATEARKKLQWGATPHLFTIGRIEWQKGHTLAIEALSKLKHLDWRYVIAGSGSGMEEVKAAIRHYDLKDRVVPAGRISEEDKRLMMSAADLFLWPERTHPAFGLVGLEAMLYNTPVLATGQGAIPEVLGDDGWVCDSLSVEGFRAKLETLLSEPAQLQKMADGLRERVQARLSFDQSINAVHDVYRNTTPHPESTNRAKAHP